MRLLVSVFLVLLLAACNQEQRVIKKITGTWTLRKFLQNDGSEVYPVEKFVFADGDAENYNEWLVYRPFDTITGSYKVYNKGMKIVLKTPTTTDSCSIEDRDAKMLIIRNPQGVMFLER